MGRDANGKTISDMLKKEKVAFLGKESNEETSGFSVVLISKEHHRSILVYKGINNTISENDVKKFDTEWLYLSSMMKQSFQTQLNLAKRLKERCVKIAFNPSEYLMGNENVKALLKFVDVLILNKEESELLTKEKDRLGGLQKLGPKIIVITDGENQVYCRDGEKNYIFKPKKIKVVDKTGAGDAFSAGFVAGLIKNKPIEFCLKLGAREAEGAIKHIGAKNNLLRMKLR
jgi:ribokinase